MYAALTIPKSEYKTKENFLVLYLFILNWLKLSFNYCHSGTQTEEAAPFWDIVAKIKEYMIEAYSDSSSFV